jgi:hypothetical protein
MNFVIDMPKMLGQVSGVKFSIVKDGPVISEHPGAAVIEVHSTGNPDHGVVFVECPNHPWLYHVVLPDIWRHLLNGPDVGLLGDPATGDCGSSATFKACVIENDPPRLTRFLAALN